MKILSLILIAVSAFSQTSIFPGAVVTDNQLGIAANITRAQLANSVGLTDTTFNVTNSSCVKAGFAASCASTFVPNMMLVLDNEAVQICQVTPGAVTTALKIGHSSCPNIDGRGFDSTVIATHNAAIITSISIAWNHNAQNKEIEALEANASGNATFAALAYNFPAQTPGGSLAAGSNTITVQPVPGLSGTDLRHFLYVSGGTGTAEPCLVTGGTAVSNVAGTIVMTCSFTHIGAWTISSVLAGLPEATYAACAAGGGTVTMKPGDYTIFGQVTVPCNSITWQGGGGVCCGLGTWIHRTGDFGDSVQIGTSTLQINNFKMFDMSWSFTIGYIAGNPGTVTGKPSAGAHLRIWGTNTATIARNRFENMVQNVVVHGTASVTIRDNQFQGLWNATSSTVQVTSASIFVNQLASSVGSGIPTNLQILGNNVFVGYPTSSPGYTAAGPRQNIEIDACEYCGIDGAYFGGGNVNNILISGVSPQTLLNIGISNSGFDSAGVADIQIQSDGTMSPTDISLSNLLMNGEAAGTTAISVPNHGSGVAGVTGLSISNVHAWNYLSTPLLFMDGTGMNIHGGQIWYYNVGNTFATAIGSSAMYFGGRSNRALITGVSVGGGLHFGDFGTDGNFCNFGIQSASPTTTQQTIRQFGNYPPFYASLGNLTDPVYSTQMFSYPGATVTVHGPTSVTGSTTMGCTNETNTVSVPCEIRGTGLWNLNHIASYVITPPTVAGSCGTSPTVNAQSTDNGGSFTAGTGSPTSCVITFSTPFLNTSGTGRAPFCTVNPVAGGAAPAIAALTNQLTVTTSTASAVYNWTCQ